ncbi:MAG: type I methionyl aminopeptidase [Candidatus Omnitrophota bacterium]|nr:type I methionyl aminopeptidase [Candidatus Omnitrophota bacterium]MDZ4242904.1 type I methionyl aminopeptidase [Candidatus Omnitrophota bacterium]
MKKDHHIKIKSPEEVEILRQAGRKLAAIIRALSGSLTSGMTTRDVDALAEKLIQKEKVRAAFKGYRGYPASTCVSVNHEVVHGIPGKKVLRDGDIVSVDVGIIDGNYYSDSAVTIGVGPISAELKRLMDVTREALRRGIAQAKPENHVSDISSAVQSYVEANHLSVVRDFVGHGIGKALHEEPEIPNYGPPHNGPVLAEGMVLAIEPMVNLGTWQTRILEDGWTVVTSDGKPSAHFEHTIAITAEGPEILTG